MPLKLKPKLTKMLKQEIEKLIIDYGVKKESIIKTIDSNRVTFAKKLKDNSFDQVDCQKLYEKYSGLLR